jgi:Survival protein SurE
MVFAPVPELTVTIEDRNGLPDLHLHAGSQGVRRSGERLELAYAPSEVLSRHDLDSLYEIALISHDELLADGCAEIAELEQLIAVMQKLRGAGAGVLVVSRADSRHWPAYMFGAPPELVLSGVNEGANIGRAVLHSGTVGAALTGALQGARAMAVSLAVSLNPERPRS